jgi:hypothetical protein
MTQTTEGTGAGSVYDILPRIVQNIVGDSILLQAGDAGDDGQAGGAWKSVNVSAIV